MIPRYFRIMALALEISKNGQKLMMSLKSNSFLPDVHKAWSQCIISCPKQNILLRVVFKKFDKNFK